MSTDLQTQIRHLATQVEAGQDPVTVDEVRLRVDRRDDTEPVIGHFPPVRRLSLPRGPWPAVIAAVVVILLFGALAFLLPGDEAVPPADSLPPLEQGQSGYYAPSVVPDGFVLLDVKTIQNSLIYVREFDGTWLPPDGGFVIESPFPSGVEIPDELGDDLETVLAAVPGSSRVEVGGRPGIILEAQYGQEDLSTPLIWVLVTDGQGGVWEMSAVGLGRDQVLAVAGSVERVTLDDFLARGAEITWDVQFGDFHEGSTYPVPDSVDDLATNVEVTLGLDVLGSRLAHASQSPTVVTTDDGQVVESGGEPIRSRMANLFLEVTDGDIDEVLRAYPHSELSPGQRKARVDGYLDQLRGGLVLSEYPYVIQAPSGPEPEFGVSSLGVELPLVPATADVVPDPMLSGPVGDVAVATEDRPVIVMGTAREPDSERPAVTLLVWFTEKGVTCQGRVIDGGAGSGCGFEVLARFGPGGESTSESIEGVFGELDYTVPLETSVVQILTPSQDYWQRPVGGYGVIPYGDTVERPTTIRAFDARGELLGSWDIDSR